MSIKIAIVSDTHAHLDENIVELIKQCDYAVHAGDICGEAVLESMKPKGGKLLAVAGNNDPYCHEVELPEVLHIELPGGRLSVEHGHTHGMQQPCHDSLRAAYPDSRVVVYGHTHKQVIDKTATPWVINPGAAGQTRTHGGPSCLLLEIDNDTWEVEALRFPESQAVVGTA